MKHTFSRRGFIQTVFMTLSAVMLARCKIGIPSSRLQELEKTLDRSLTSLIPAGQAYLASNSDAKPDTRDLMAALFRLGENEIPAEQRQEAIFNRLKDDLDKGRLFYWDEWMFTETEAILGAIAYLETY